MSAGGYISLGSNNNVVVTKEQIFNFISSRYHLPFKVYTVRDKHQDIYVEFEINIEEKYYGLLVINGTIHELENDIASILRQERFKIKYTDYKNIHHQIANFDE